MEDKLNPDLQNTIIRDTVQNTVFTHFPIVGKTHTLELVGPLKVDDNLSDWDYPLQKEMKLSGKSWAIPLTGSFRLIDNKTGQVLDTVRNLKIANIPKMTDRFSIMIDGNEYTTMNQFRLKPGIYTRKKANGEMESQFNLEVGHNFKMEMDPAEGIFYLYIANQRFHVYTLLHAFGFPDSEILKAWGQQLLDKNKSVGLNEEGREIPLMWEKLRKQKLPYEKALELLKDYFDKTKISVDTTAMTLGKSIDKVTPEALLLTSAKLLRVMRGEDKEDERDSLLFKELNTVDDLLRKYFEKKSPTIQKNLTFRTDNKTSIREIISPDTYTKSIKEFFTKGDLSNPSPQTNPVEMLGEWRKTTIAGTGGIQSEHAITFKTRDVHPSHFGFLDPLNTPESSKVGVTLPLALQVRKEGNEIKTPVIFTSDGKEKYVNPKEFYDMRIGFPDQHVDGKPKYDTIKAMYRGESVILPSHQIEGYLSHPTTMFAWTTNLVPFLGNNSGNRALVAAKMVTQSVALKNPETPLVKVITETGATMDQVLGDYLKPKVPDGWKDAVVEKIEDDYITLKNKSGEKTKIGLYKDFPLNQESFIDSTTTVKVGDKVKEGQPLANLNFNDPSGQFAPGVNVNVAYMPWHGYNFEDGIVVSDSLAKKMTSVVMIKKSLQIGPRSLLDLQKFVSYYPQALTSENISKLDSNGVIKEGQIVKAREALIAYLNPIDPTDTEKILRSMNKMLSNPYRNQSLMWDSEHEGKVTHVRKVGNTYDIYVKEEQPLVIGDKLAARYGDKGIVTKIIPDAQAPHTKDGKRIDMMVNIHGVPGRMNMGQMLETAAGKWSVKTGKPYLVENFSDKDYLGDIMSKLKEENIPADEILLDGKDGKPFGKPIFWGNKHYLKLMHVIDHKFKSRDIPGSYDANEQPVQGDKGGQSMDQLQMYAYLAHGARENLYEMTAVKGQKNDEYWRNLQLGFPPPPPQKSFVFDKMMHYIQAAGVNTKKDGYRIKLFPATSKDVVAQSKGALTDAGHLLRGKDLVAINGGLFDPKLTGGMKGSNWTHIMLNEEIPNPLYENAVKSLLKINSTQFGKIMNEDGEENKTGPRIIGDMLGKIDVAKDLADARKQIKTASPLQINALNKRIRYLETLKEHKLSARDAYMMKALPVLPPVYRPVYPLPSGDIQVSPINKHYRDVALINDQIKQVRDAGIDDKEFNKDNRKNLYESTKALIGLADPITHTKEKYEGLLATLSGDSPKQGFIQNKVWAKRQDLSARTTITVEPSLGLDEVGMPDAALKDIFKPFIVREIIGQGYKPVQALEEVKKWSPIADQALNNVIKKRPVLLNRAPTLHKHGVQAFKAVRFDGHSMRVNPLVAKGFGFDFDGDTMSVHVPISEKAVAEAQQMFPSKNLYKAGDMAHMINIDQDYQLGLFYLSVMGPETNRAFTTLEEAEKAIKDKTAIFRMGGKRMTLGQYYINEFLPPDLQNYEREMDGKTVKKIMTTLNDHHPDIFGKVVDHWKELGRSFAVERGSTISITDMVMDRTSRNNIIKKYDALVKPDMDKEQKAEIYERALVEIEKEQDKQMTGKNNFYDMLRAGSTGRKNQITQILSMPGVFRDVHGTPIPYPVKRGWAEGLDTFDYWNSSYGARKGVVDRSVNTQESGALNKGLLANTKGLLVSEADCDTPDGLELDLESKEIFDRYLAKAIPGVGSRNDLIDSELLSKAKRKNVSKVWVRSPLTCEAEDGVCQKCYGLMANGQPPRIGENVGVIDSQALTERSTQLTMQCTADSFTIDEDNKFTLLSKCYTQKHAPEDTMVALYLSDGGCMIVQNNHPMWINGKEALTSNIIPGDTVENALYKITTIYSETPKSDSVAAAPSYWMGAFVGDGCFRYYTERPEIPRACIITNMRDDIKEKLNALVPGSIRDLDYQVYNTDFALNVIQQVRPYAKHKALLLNWAELSKEWLAGFISGLIDTDGCINRKGVKIYSTSFALLDQVRIMAAILQLPSTLRLEKRRDHQKTQQYALKIRGTSDLKTILKESIKVQKDFVNGKLYMKPVVLSATSAVTSKRTIPIQSDIEMVYDRKTDDKRFITSNYVNHNTFHTGGAGKGSAVIAGFPRLEELLFVPQTVKDAGVLARENGTVSSILDNPAGGQDLFINKIKYYIPRERKLLVTVGTMVHKGDRLTDGSIKPQELSELKNHLTAQQYVADEINNVYENKFARKTFETVLRGISNNAEVTKVPDHVDRPWIPGDVAQVSTIKKLNRGYKAEGLPEIEYNPYFKSIDVLPLDSRDWLSRLTTNRLKQTIQDAAAMGMSSNTKGTDPMAAYLAALGFGQNLDPKKKQFY